MNKAIYFLFFLLFCNSFFAKAQSLWPLDNDNSPENGISQEAQHPIIGMFGQYFTEEGNILFNPGVDIYAPQGTPVYAVSSNTVAYVDIVKGIVAIGKFWYQNLTDIKVNINEQVSPGTLIGYVNNQAYLHFRENATSINTTRTNLDWVNPVAEGHQLSNYQDNIAPVIRGVKLTVDGQESSVFTPNQLITGNVDIIVDAYDPATWTPGQANHTIKCGIKEIEIQFEDLDGNLIMNNDIPVSFKFDITNENQKLPVSGAAQAVFGNNSSSTQFNYFVTSLPFDEAGNYDKFWNTLQKKGGNINENAQLAEEALFPDGEYNIRVIAKDFRGNEAEFSFSEEENTIIDVALQKLSILYGDYTMPGSGLYAAPFWSIENKSITTSTVYIHTLNPAYLDPVFTVLSNTTPSGPITILAEWEDGSATTTGVYSSIENTITVENPEELAFQLPFDYKIVEDFPISFTLTFENNLPLKSTSNGVSSVSAGTATGTIIEDLTRSVAESRAYNLNQALGSKIMSVVHCEDCNSNDGTLNVKHFTADNGMNATKVKDGKSSCIIIYYKYNEAIPIAEVNKIPASQYTKITFLWDNYLSVWFTGKPSKCADCSKYIEELESAFKCEVGWEGDPDYINLLFNKIEACLLVSPLTTETDEATTLFRDNPEDSNNRTYMQNSIISRLDLDFYEQEGDPTYFVTMQYQNDNVFILSPKLNGNAANADINIKYEFGNGEMNVKVDVSNEFIKRCIDAYVAKMTDKDYYFSEAQIEDLKNGFKEVAKATAYLAKKRAEAELKNTEDLKKPEEFLTFWQVSYKCLKNLWYNQTVLEGMWYKRNELYPQIPHYADLGPIAGGFSDEVIGTIAGPQIMQKMVLELIADDGQLAAFKQIFTEEGLINMAKGLLSEITEIAEEPEKTEYYCSRAVTQIGLDMLTGGLGLAASLPGKTSKATKTVKNAFGTLGDHHTALKNYYQRLKDINKKRARAFEKLLKKVGEANYNKLEDLLSKIPEHKIDDLIDDINDNRRLLDDLVDNDLLDAWEAVSTHKKIRKHLPSLKKVSDLLLDNDFLTKIGGQTGLDEVLAVVINPLNKGANDIMVTLTEHLENVRIIVKKYSGTNTDGIDKLIGDIKNPNLTTKQKDGLSHMLNDAKNYDKIKKFDYEFEGDGILCTKCRFDLELDDPLIKLIEHKSWKLEFIDKISTKQLTEYFNNVEKLSEMRYVFNKLKTPDVAAVREKFKEIFINRGKMEEIFTSLGEDKFYELFNVRSVDNFIKNVAPNLSGPTSIYNFIIIN